MKKMNLFLSSLVLVMMSFHSQMALWGFKNVEFIEIHENDVLQTEKVYLPIMEGKSAREEFVEYQNKTNETRETFVAAQDAVNEWIEVKNKKREAEETAELARKASDCLSAKSGSEAEM